MIVECVLLVTIIWQIGFDYISHDGLEDSWFLQLYIYIFMINECQTILLCTSVNNYYILLCHFESI